MERAKRWAAGSLGVIRVFCGRSDVFFVTAAEGQRYN